MLCPCVRVRVWERETKFMNLRVCTKIAKRQPCVRVPLASGTTAGHAAEIALSARDVHALEREACGHSIAHTSSNNTLPYIDRRRPDGSSD